MGGGWVGWACGAGGRESRNKSGHPLHTVHRPARNNCTFHSRAAVPHGAMAKCDLPASNSFRLAN